MYWLYKYTTLKSGKDGYVTDIYASAVYIVKVSSVYITLGHRVEWSL